MSKKPGRFFGAGLGAEGRLLLLKNIPIIYLYQNNAVLSFSHNYHPENRVYKNNKGNIFLPYGKNVLPKRKVTLFLM
ncbi:MAG: hypothetical protein A2562_03305 [Candidatus Nealsonbacteria bacterium RIFOXYD1_FULL_39_11]|nr:MAG: hypothetical protein A2562_03305 [Candidatus Nealsonbacteria bacterium RIFOXYD1_FULL_39_11]